MSRSQNLVLFDLVLFFTEYFLCFFGKLQAGLLADFFLGLWTANNSCSPQVWISAGPSKLKWISWLHP